jgi:hypothetical protein
MILCILRYTWRHGQMWPNLYKNSSFVLVVLGLELRAAPWPTPAALFALVTGGQSCIVQDWNMTLLVHAARCSLNDRCVPPSLAFFLLRRFESRMAWNSDPPHLSPLQGIMAGVNHCTQLLVRYSLMNFFCWGWPWAAIFSILASQIARIIGRSHWYLAV